jgi:glycosyltransferase involved in cell wall biosynthesis
MQIQRSAMRIAFLGDGSLNHVHRWAGYFAGRGHDVLVITFEDVSGCPVPCRRVRTILPTKLLGYIGALGSVKSELEYFRPDIVNAIYVGGYGLVGSLSGFRPLVISAIGSDMLVDFPSSFVHRAQIRHALKRADMVTTDAAVLTRAIASLGIPPYKIIEAVFGIDEEIFHPDPEEREDHAPRIISTRNLSEIYDITTLIEALPKVLERTRAELVICGEGPARSMLERRASSLGIAEKIAFKGRLEPRAIAQELNRADIYVSTSRSDSTSVSLLEAMACGVPPIVTDIEANREWIKSGENGLLFPTGDAGALAEAILEMLGDEDLATGARERNIALVKERAIWKDNMQRIEMEFERLAAGTRQG